MTQLNIQLPANLPEATTLQRLRQFLLTNGYYELESDNLLRFKNYPENRMEKSPAAIPHELKFALSGDQIQVAYQANSGHQKWEHRYVELLMLEMQKAIESGNSKMLNLADLEKQAEASLFRPAPQWAKNLRWILGIVAFAVYIYGGQGFYNWQFWTAFGIIISYNLFFYLSYRRPRAVLQEG